MSNRKYINLNKEICFRPKADGLHLIEGRNDVRQLADGYYATTMCTFMELFGGYRMSADYNKHVRFDVYFNIEEFSTEEEVQRAIETQQKMEQNTDMLSTLVYRVLEEIKNHIQIDKHNRVISSGKMVSCLCAMDKKVVLAYDSESDEVTVGVNVIQYYVHRVMEYAEELTNDTDSIARITSSDVLSVILSDMARNNQLVYKYGKEKLEVSSKAELPQDVGI